MKFLDGKELKLALLSSINFTASREITNNDETPKRIAIYPAGNKKINKHLKICKGFEKNCYSSSLLVEFMDFFFFLFIYLFFSYCKQIFLDSCKSLYLLCQCLAILLLG